VNVFYVSVKELSVLRLALRHQNCHPY